MLFFYLVVRANGKVWNRSPKKDVAPMVAYKTQEPELRTPKVWNMTLIFRKKSLTQVRHTLLNKLQDLHKCHFNYRDPEDLKSKISHTNDLFNGYQQAFDMLATLFNSEEHRKLQEAFQAVQIQWKGTKESVLDRIQKLEREDVLSTLSIDHHQQTAL